MISIIENLLSKQEPIKPHTLLTRFVVSFCICLAYVVLYGFYGLLAAIVVYLVGVELLGFPLQWMFYPVILGLLFSCWKSLRDLRDYWKNFGKGSS